jgi:hypothetical protein
VLDDDELALLELHCILSKRGCTRCCFDYVVEWLEQHISAGTFNKKWQASASSGIDEWTYFEVSNAPLLHGDYDA